MESRSNERLSFLLLSNVILSACEGSLIARLRDFGIPEGNLYIKMSESHRMAHISPYDTIPCDLLRPNSDHFSGGRE